MGWKEGEGEEGISGGERMERERRIAEGNDTTRPTGAEGEPVNGQKREDEEEGEEEGKEENHPEEEGEKDAESEESEDNDPRQGQEQIAPRSGTQMEWRTWPELYTPSGTPSDREEALDEEAREDEGKEDGRPDGQDNRREAEAQALPQMDGGGDEEEKAEGDTISISTGEEGSDGGFIAVDEEEHQRQCEEAARGGGSSKERGGGGAEETKAVVAMATGHGTVADAVEDLEGEAGQASGRGARKGLGSEKGAPPRPPGKDRQANGADARTQRDQGSRRVGTRAAEGDRKTDNLV
jgi:hypothetical protein